MKRIPVSMVCDRRSLSSTFSRRATNDDGDDDDDAAAAAVDRLPLLRRPLPRRRYHRRHAHRDPDRFVVRTRCVNLF